MNSHGHFIEKCKYCGVVIAQCRCIGPKETRYSVCTACAKRIALGQSALPILRREEV